MQPQWIAVAIAIASFAGGVLHHYMYVRVEIEKLKLENTHMKMMMQEVKEHLPAIHEKVNSISEGITELRTKLNMLHR